jgi:hypothetical protein
MGKESEVQPITDPGPFIEELKAQAWALSNPERTYHLQVGLKDLEFDVDQEKAKRLGLSFPVSSIDEAERALQAGAIAPTRFTECGDDTVHEVIEFDPTPVGYSGFANCVTHCLAWTDHGIFEVGRYSAMNLPDFSKTWQWFIHRRRMTAGQVKELLKASMSPQEIFDLVYEEITGMPRYGSGAPLS